MSLERQRLAHASSAMTTAPVSSAALGRPRAIINIATW
jgi:hypothetical protein